MKKKSVVLFMTLMFILLMSSLVLKNLEHTSDYIEQSNQDTTDTKLLMGLKNIQEEFLRYFLQNQSNIAELLQKEPFNSDLILEYVDVKATLQFTLYENKYNINLLIEKEQEKYKEIETLFTESNVSGFDFFRDLVIEYNSKYGMIENFEQLNYVVNDFIKLTSNSAIESIRASLGFLDLTDKAFVLANVNMALSKESIKSQFLYNLTGKTIQGLTIVFK